MLDYFGRPFSTAFSPIPNFLQAAQDTVESSSTPVQVEGMAVAYVIHCPRVRVGTWVLFLFWNLVRFSQQQLV